MRVKGMGDIATINALVRRAVPRTKAQVVAELAYLEHEKARLERELELWTGNWKRTEAQILLNQERMTYLKAILQEEHLAASKELAADESQGNDGQRADGWREVKLEY